MRPKESLHYAIGQLAFAIARSDGEVQKEERQKFHDIVAAGLRGKDQDFDVSGIIFQIMDKNRSSAEDAYHSAMNEIRLNSHYLSPELKKTFVHVLEKVAKAYPPVTIDEEEILERFKREIAPIHGDPVYYAPKQ